MKPERDKERTHPPGIGLFRLPQDRKPEPQGPDLADKGGKDSHGIWL